MKLWKRWYLEYYQGVLTLENLALFDERIYKVDLRIRKRIRQWRTAFINWRQERESRPKVKCLGKATVRGKL